MIGASPRVSIIIPVYNVESCLDYCMQSVTEQTYKKIEIILIDDGSTDQSSQKCDQWAEKDHRIKVIHQKNAGLNMARKAGFLSSTGKFVTFLDSDDCFHPETIKTTLSLALKKELDMVAFLYAEFSSNDGLNYPTYDNISFDVKHSSLEVFRFLINCDYEHLYPMTAWGKLYKHSLLESVNWDISNLKAFEDNFLTPQILDHVSSFAVLKQQLYFYRRSSNDQNTLSKTIVGNHRNNQPIGYLEYLDLLRDYWSTFLKKHSLNLEEELGEFWISNMLFRLKNLIAASALCEENNINYIMEIVDYLQLRHSREVAKKQQIIENLEAELLTLTDKQSFYFDPSANS